MTRREYVRRLMDELGQSRVDAERNATLWATWQARRRKSRRTPPDAIPDPPAPSAFRRPWWQDPSEIA